MDTLIFPASSRPFLEPYLPPIAPTETQKDEMENPLPFATLTFATSLDSSLSLAPGTRTTLSGPQSKAMTHYLRSRHAAILIGVGTALADNPGLNCRIEGVGGYGSPGLDGQPRPIVLDPKGRWRFGADAKILTLAREGRGRVPFVIIGRGVSVDETRRRVLEDCGGRFLELEVEEGKGFDWGELLRTLKREGLESVMIEGGGAVINSLLEPGFQHLVDSVIVTIAPTWLGKGGVVVSPDRRVDEQGTAIAASRLKDVQWHPFGEDVVLCGRMGQV
ncbi:dihydrofolate reductase-like domain-containing protein [Aspergillus insuetus]